jgi:hypothetical protein
VLAHLHIAIVNLHRIELRDDRRWVQRLTILKTSVEVFPSALHATCLAYSQFLASTKLSYRAPQNEVRKPRMIPANIYRLRDGIVVRSLAAQLAIRQRYTRGLEADVTSPNLFQLPSLRFQTEMQAVQLRSKLRPHIQQVSFPGICCLPGLIQNLLCRS